MAITPCVRLLWIAVAIGSRPNPLQIWLRQISRYQMTQIQVWTGKSSLLKMATVKTRLMAAMEMTALMVGMETTRLMAEMEMTPSMVVMAMIPSTVETEMTVLMAAMEMTP
jgi:hypothetical protein